MNKDYCKLDTKVILSKNDFDLIVEHGKSCLPEEACGLIAGLIEEVTADDSEHTYQVKTVKKVYPMTNTDHSNEHFNIDPMEQLKAIKDMRALGFVPLGNFHSHPETPSRPSEEDKKLAYDSKPSYMILSLMDGTNPVLNSFHIESDNVKIEKLVISEG
ncbi:MAG: M67 family metallopeptidase [Clostridiales Family XIII bacterium]|jgi:proteasome lid subunit RPN8/RPN11|nr:M67 family metallopeptidase [Clostridiales Family XIII bacterium]